MIFNKKVRRKDPKTEKYHIIKINEGDNTDKTFFRENLQKYCKYPRDEEEQSKKSSEER